MVIEPTNRWVETYMAELSDCDLPILFSDIASYRRTGLLRPDSPLLVLDKVFCRELRTGDDSMLRTVEDAVLFEMSRRYSNALEDDREASVAGWKLSGDLSVRIFHNKDPEALWKFVVSADRSDNLRLGHFDTEEAARAFVAEHGYACVNDGKVEEW